MAARLRFGCCIVFSVIALTCAGYASAEPKIHVVYKGQRLGSIAKRYNVSIDALCQANGIHRSKPIFPGQKLVIPSKSKTFQRRKQAQKSTTAKDSSGSRLAADALKVHVVYKGQRLGSIAKRYGVSIDALCHANGIDRRDPIKPGQRLVVPGRDDESGELSRQAFLQKKAAAKRESSERAVEAKGRRALRKAKPSWSRYLKLPWKRGYVRLSGYNRRFEGYVIGPGNKVLGAAKKQISAVLGADEGATIHTRLVRLIADVSDAFGGRALRIVSGYRESSYAAASRHKVGRALDFSIPGVPNEALRDYLRAKFENVGIGYYPNSSFVHLDVREYNAYWVDDSGPGEPPRYRRVSGGGAASASLSARNRN